MMKKLIFKSKNIAQIQNPFVVPAPSIDEFEKEESLSNETAQYEVPIPNEKQLHHLSQFEKIEQIEDLLDATKGRPSSIHIPPVHTDKHPEESISLSIAEIEDEALFSNEKPLLDEETSYMEESTAVRDLHENEITSSNIIDIPLEQIEEEAQKVLLEIKEQIRKMKEDSQEESKKIIEDAKLQINAMQEQQRQEYQRKTENIKKEENEIYEKAQKEGSAKGYKEGKDEIQRLVQTLSNIITEASDLHKKIIVASEKQMVEQILLIARKVIKDETNTRKTIVVNNVKSALKNMSQCEKVKIRVNVQDLEVSSEHKKEFIHLLQENAVVTILEDSRIEKGGCVVESNIGSIDAKISTQLALIEQAIQSVNPI